MNKKKKRHPAGAKAVNRSHAAKAKIAGNNSLGQRRTSGAYITGSSKGTGDSYGSPKRSSASSGRKRPSSVSSNGNKKKNLKHKTRTRQGTYKSAASRPRLVENSGIRPYGNDLVNSSYYRQNERKEYQNRKPKKPKVTPGEFLRLHKSILILFFTIFLVCIIGLGVLQYIRTHYKVKTANVVGNTYYTDEEIQDMVMDGMFAHNSLYLSFKYHNKSIGDIPFIEKITVDIESADTINIHVYEKALAGCISYLENYMYFDREGIIVEGSSELLDGVPVVKGLKFDRVVLYEALPVEDSSIFAEILDLTQLLAKYDLHADQMYFDSAYNVYLYFDNIEVVIGSEENIDEKVIQLPYILPSLEGKKGTLHLEEYDENTDSVRFEEAT